MGKRTVGVRCNGKHAWTIYVPVSVKVMTEVIIAKRALERGTIISAADVGLEQRDISRLHRGYLEQKNLAVGKKLKQRVRRNQIVSPSQLDSPQAIKRNNRVTILASNRMIQVRMAGKALQNGSIGDLIRVRNESSKRELDAMVVAPGIVRVAM